jgi:DNA-directed RNA polymerase subunit RPC12/RpoP
VDRSSGQSSFAVTGWVDTFFPIDHDDMVVDRMTNASYACDGCRATIETVGDMRKEQGTVSSQWRCRLCGTTVPAVVAEKIKHQQQ